MTGLDKEHGGRRSDEDINSLPENGIGNRHHQPWKEMF